MRARTRSYTPLERAISFTSHARRTTYAICEHHGLTKRKIIKTRARRVGHLDCHYLGKDQVVGSKRRHCLVSMLEARARLAWAEVVDDFKSLSVMFAALRSTNLMNVEYGFGSRRC